MQIEIAGGIDENLARDLDYFDSSTCLIVNKNADVSIWVNNLKQLGSDSQISQRSKNLIQQEFSVERMARDYGRLYQKMALE